MKLSTQPECAAADPAGATAGPADDRAAGPANNGPAGATADPAAGATANPADATTGTAAKTVSAVDDWTGSSEAGNCKSKKEWSPMVGGGRGERVGKGNLQR